MNDLKFAFRQLLKNPGFTAVAVLTLALGIGANTALFSVVNSVLLRPLDYPKSERLVWLSERGLNWSDGAIAYPNFIDWKNQQAVFENFGVFTWIDLTLTGRGEPAQVSASAMSADVFAALAVQPELGRAFRADEDKPGAEPVAVISHSLWRDRFGSDAGVLNQTITLNGQPCVISGVMPAGFDFPGKVDIWVPIGPLSVAADWQDRGNHPGLQALGRLKSGATLKQARAELDTIALRLEQQYPESNKNRRVQIDRLLDHRVGNVRRALWILLGAVSLVLIIACANVANLLLARAATREREIAVRAALGASQWRITRQLLTESLLLAIVGAITGLLLAHGGLRLILALAGEALPRAHEIGLDLRVLLFSASIAVLTGLLFGLAPAFHARRVDLQGTLKEAGRAITSSRARLRQGLVVAEVALTFVLLIGAGLLLVSFSRLLRVNPGFSVERVLTFQINLPERKYANDAQQIRFYQDLLEKLRGLPGVQAASLAWQIPLDDHGWDTTFLIEGRPAPPPHERPSLQVHVVGPDYFRTMGLPILQGRDFNAQDNRQHVLGSNRQAEWAGALNTVIIDEQFASKHWPGENALGQRIRLPWAKDRAKEPVMTVVGVVGRVKEVHLNEKTGMVQAYFPFLQQPIRSMDVALKTTIEPSSMLNAIRQKVSQLDPEQPIFGIHTMKQMRDKDLAPERLNLALLAAFAGLALVLAIVGLYGLLAFTVTQRQREIGVRMALGAQRLDVLSMVLRQGARLISLGVAIGLLAAFAFSRILKSILFDVQPTDPLTFSVVTIILCGVALVACYIPARRATKIHPMEALRYE